MRSISVVFGILIFSNLMTAQERVKNSPVVAGKEPGYNSIMFSIDYATNTNILDNINPAIRQPSITPSVAFISKFGLDAMLGWSLTDNSDDSLQGYANEFDFIIAYNFKPLKNLTVYPSYSHFEYSKNTGVFNSIFKNDLRMDALYTVKRFGLNISAGYMWGRQHNFYSGINGDMLFTINQFLFGGGLGIQPGAELSFGSYEYLNLVYLDEIRQNPDFYRYLLWNSPALRRYIFREILQNPGTSAEQIIDGILEERAKDGFKATSVTLALPFYYMINNLGFNFAFYMFFPLNTPDYITDKAMFYFNAGVSYNFDF